MYKIVGKYYYMIRNACRTAAKCLDSNVLPAIYPEHCRRRGRGFIAKKYFMKILAS